MARVFISHSSRDGEQAERLHKWVRDQGSTDTFLDIDKHAGLMPGDDWERRLYREIAASEAVILILTKNWFESKWCFAEFIQARALGKAIFPVIETPTGETFVSPDIQHLDLVKDREGGLERLGSELTRLALNARGTFPWERSRSPFPGLLAFGEADAAIYFGRDDDIRRLIERLNARRAQGGVRLIALLGASGSGKSSLLRAGVVPRLKRDRNHWIVLPPFRPQLHPVDEFAQAIAAALGPKGNWRTCRETLTSVDKVRALSELARDLREAQGANEAQILVSIDQAEELFGTTETTEAEQFLAVLNAVLDEHSPFIAVMTLRSDYLDRLQKVANLNFEEFSLKPLPLERVRDIIEGPARVAALTVEDGFVAAAMKDAATEDALPLLAFTLRELRDRYGGDRLSLADYRSLGDEAAEVTPLENSVRKRADEVLAAAKPSPDQLDALREAFIPAMVRVNEGGEYVRRPARWGELPAVARPLLESLANARLLVIRQENNEKIVEVVHEALLRKWPRLRQWLDQEREFLIGKAQLERALADWEKTDPTQKTTALLQGLPLIRARQWLTDHPRALSPAEQSYIKASLAHAEAEERRRTLLRRTVTWGAVASAVVLAALAAVAGWQWREAQAAERRAVAQRDLAQAALLAVNSQSALAANDLRQAVGYALKAVETAASEETRSALLQSVVALSPHLVRDLSVHDMRPAALAWASDGKQVIVGGLNGQVLAWRPYGAAPVRDVSSLFVGGGQSAITTVAWTRDHGLLAVVNDGRLVHLDPEQKQAATSQGQLIADIKKSSISARGFTVLAASQSEAAVYSFGCRKKSESSQEVDCAKSLIAEDYATATAIDEDGKTAAVALENGGLLIADLTRKSTLARVDLGARVQSLAWSRDGKWLAAGTVSGQVFVLGREGERLAELPAQSNAITTVAWDRSSSRLAAACDTNAICIWQPAKDAEPSFRLAARLLGHTGTIAAIEWSPTGEALASAAIDETIKLWTPAAVDHMSFALHTPEGVPLIDLDASADGQWLAAGDENGAIQVWNLKTFALAGSLPARRSAEIRSVKWHPKNAWIAASDVAGWISVRSWPARELVKEIQIAENVVETVRWLPDGATVAATLRDGRIALWSVQDGTVSYLKGEHKESAVGLAVDARRNHILSTDALGETWLWDIASLQKVAALPAAKTGRGTVALSHDARFAVTAGNDGDVIVYDLDGQRIHNVFQRDSRQMENAVFGPSDALVAAISADGFLDLWSLNDRKRFVSIKPYPDRRPLEQLHAREGTSQLRSAIWLPALAAVAISTSNGEVRLVSSELARWRDRATSVFVPN